MAYTYRYSRESSSVTSAYCPICRVKTQLNPIMEGTVKIMVPAGKLACCAAHKIQYQGMRAEQQVKRFTETEELM